MEHRCLDSGVHSLETASTKKGHLQLVHCRWIAIIVLIEGNSIHFQDTWCSFSFCVGTGVCVVSAQDFDRRVAESFSVTRTSDVFLSWSVFVSHSSSLSWHVSRPLGRCLTLYHFSSTCERHTYLHTAYIVKFFSARECFVSGWDAWFASRDSCHESKNRLFHWSEEGHSEHDRVTGEGAEGWGLTTLQSENAKSTLVAVSLTELGSSSGDCMRF